MTNIWHFNHYTCKILSLNKDIFMAAASSEKQSSFLRMSEMQLRVQINFFHTIEQAFSVFETPRDTPRDIRKELSDLISNATNLLAELNTARPHTTTKKRSARKIYPETELKNIVDLEAETQLSNQRDRLINEVEQLKKRMLRSAHNQHVTPRLTKMPTMPIIMPSLEHKLAQEGSLLPPPETDPLFNSRSTKRRGGINFK
jgi:3-dehydroquinate dehydratase